MRFEKHGIGEVMSNSEIIEWLKKKAETVTMPGARKMYQAAVKALEEQQEPKRGRWIYKTDLITAPTGYWECSECKEGRLLYEENFCPHCGAQMDEVVSDNNVGSKTEGEKIPVISSRLNSSPAIIQ